MSENIKELSIDSIDNGRFARGFNNALQEAGDDCIARSRNLKPRVVNVRVELIPKPIGDTERIHIRVVTKVNKKNPDSPPAETIAFVRNGKVFIDVFNPAEPFQDTFDLSEMEEQ